MAKKAKVKKSGFRKVLKVVGLAAIVLVAALYIHRVFIREVTFVYPEGTKIEFSGDYYVSSSSPGLPVNYTFHDSFLYKQGTSYNVLFGEKDAYRNCVRESYQDTGAIENCDMVKAKDGREYAMHSYPDRKAPTNLALVTELVKGSDDMFSPNPSQVMSVFIRSDGKKDAAGLQEDAIRFINSYKITEPE